MPTKSHGRRGAPPLRKVWERCVAATQERPHYLDDLWRQFKSEYRFDPADFERKPPWCIEGAENSPWARRVFLGDARREKAWSFLGYTDRPFDFAYLWLDYAGFGGLLKSSRLPLIIERSSGELRSEARQLAKQCSRLSKSLGKWAFRETLSLKNLLHDDDHRSSNTVRIFGEAAKLNQREQHVAVQAILSGIRQELPLPLGGTGSLLERAANILKTWEPPPSPVDRPRREGLKQRYAVRWLDHSLNQLGGEVPGHAKVSLIAELLHALAELGEWLEEPWDEERVRRCLDGKSKKRKRDSV